MVHHAVRHLDPAEGAILFIENVGNPVCPTLFDQGENRKVVIVSTTEGDDKPLKYPTSFREAEVCVINKIDLLPYLKADANVLGANARRVNEELDVFNLSAVTGEGLNDWCAWLLQESAKCK